MDGMQHMQIFNNIIFQHISAIEIINRYACATARVEITVEEWCYIRM